MNWKVLSFAFGLVTGLVLAAGLAAFPQPVSAQMRGGYWTHDCTVQGVDALTSAMNGTWDARDATAFYNPLARATCVIYHVGGRKDPR